MTALLSVACGSFLVGWILGRFDRETQDDPRRRFNHENRRGPVGSPPLRLDPGRVQRGNGKGGPATPKPTIIPKPQFPPPRTIPGDTP